MFHVFFFVFYRFKTQLLTALCVTFSLPKGEWHVMLLGTLLGHFVSLGKTSVYPLIAGLSDRTGGDIVFQTVHLRY